MVTTLFQRCRQKRRERLPTLNAMQERNLCLQGRMGRFFWYNREIWNHVNITTANFTFRLTIAQIRTKGKKQFNWSRLEKHFFVDRERSSFFHQSHARRAKKLNHPRSSRLRRSPLTCALCYRSTVTQKKNKRLLAV